jgi:Flp pilus assembly protein TadD
MAEAEAAYRQAIAWQDAGPPGEVSEQPLINLAIVLLHRNDGVDARPLLEKAVVLAPREPRIHEQLGQLYMQESKFGDAQRELKMACDLDPGKSNLHFLLGQAYKRLGRQNEATAEFAEAARLAKITSEVGSRK